jgi:5-methylcytosine-specific restriction endonuclease McrA
MAYKNPEDAINWRIKNKEKIKIKDAAYYLNNKDEIAKKSKIYRNNYKKEIAEINKTYYIKNKELILSKNKKYRDNNKDKIKNINKVYYEDNKESIKIKGKIYQKENPHIFIKSAKKYRKNNPWMSFYLGAKGRCENKNVPSYKYIGERGILFLLTKKDIKFLWLRDRASELKRPALSRKNRAENYTIENCKFIELIVYMNNLDNKGKKSSMYIDGRSPLNLRIRGLSKYKNLRKEVLERDNYTCQECRCKENLEVHHTIAFCILLDDFIKEYDNFSPLEEIDILVRLATKYEPFWNLDNCKTLCKDCHMETFSYGPNVPDLINCSKLSI